MTYHIIYIWYTFRAYQNDMGVGLMFFFKYVFAEQSTMDLQFLQTSSSLFLIEQ